MAEITPTPRAGSWVQTTPWHGSVAYEITPTPRAGSWVRMVLAPTTTRGYRGIGLVRGSRG